MRVFTFASALTLSVAIAGAANAATLNLTPGPPDVSSGFIAVDYNAVTHLLTADGQTQNLSPGGMFIGFGRPMMHSALPSSSSGIRLTIGPWLSLTRT